MEILKHLEIPKIKEQFARYNYVGERSQEADILRASVRANIPLLSQTLRAIRKGEFSESSGTAGYNKRIDYTLGDAVKAAFGADLNDFMHLLQFNADTMSLQDFARNLGDTQVFSAQMFRGIIDGAYSGNAVSGIDPSHSLLYTELIRRPILLAYMQTVRYPNWIAATVPVSTSESKLPILNLNDAYAHDGKGKPKPKLETSGTRRAKIEWKTKTVEVEEFPLVVEVSDKMLRDIPFNTLMFFMQGAIRLQGGVGDNLFVQTLYNGDQDNGSEKPPVLGATTEDTLIREDIERVVSRGEMLGYNYNQVIPSDKMKFKNIGAANETRLFKDFYPNIAMNNIPLVDNNGVEKIDRSIFWDKNQAIVLLNYQAPQMEQDRNAEEGSVSLIMRHFVGFAIWNKNAIMHLDEGTAFSASQYPNAHPVYRGNIGAGA